MMRSARGAFAVFAVAVCLVAGAACGCSDNSQRNAPNQQQGVADVMQQQAGQDEDDAQAGTSASGFTGDAPAAYASSDVDVDLTAMSAEMVYATVNDMLVSPEDYVGSVVKMSGAYRHSHDDETGNDYHFVVIEDATACCAQGIEFVWADGSHVYPDEFPAEDTQVVATGVFETYMEGENEYVHLVESTLQSL